MVKMNENMKNFSKELETKELNEHSRMKKKILSKTSSLNGCKSRLITAETSFSKPKMSIGNI